MDTWPLYDPATLCQGYPFQYPIREVAHKQAECDVPAAISWLIVYILARSLTGKGYEPTELVSYEALSVVKPSKQSMVGFGTYQSPERWLCYR